MSQDDATPPAGALEEADQLESELHLLEHVGTVAADVDGVSDDDSLVSHEQNGGEGEERKRKISAVFGPNAADIWGARRQTKRRRVGRTQGKNLPRDVAQALGEAHALYIKGDSAQAIERFSAVTKLAPRLPDPYLAMANIYEEAGHLMEALQLFVLAAANTSGNSELWRKVAVLASDLEQYDQAMAAIDYINRFEKMPLDGLSQKVFICLKRREDAKAYATLKSLLSKYPEEYWFLLEYAEICDSESLPLRARYAYIRFCLTCLAPHVRLGNSDILSKYHCFNPGNSVSTGQGSRHSGFHPTIGDVDVQSLLFACNKAVISLLNITYDHSLTSTALVERPSKVGGLTLIDFGVASDQVDQAHCLLTGCVDFVALLAQSLPVDCNEKPAVPVDIGLLLVLSLLYRSVGTASKPVSNSGEQASDNAKQDFVQSMAMLRPLLPQLREKGINMDAESGDHIEATAAAEAADPGFTLRIICIRIIAVLGRMGMLALAKRYAEGVSRSLPQIERTEPGSFIATSVKCYLMIEVALVQYYAGAHEGEAFSSCLSAVSISANNIAALRLLTFLSEKYSNMVLPVPEPADLARQCISMHFDALRAMLLAMCPLDANFIVVDDGGSVDKDSDEPSTSAINIRSVISALHFAFCGILDVDRQGDLSAPDVFFLYPKRVETELKVMVNWAEQLLESCDFFGYITVLIPIVSLWLNWDGFCQLKEDESGRNSLCVRQFTFLTPLQHQLSATVTSMLLYLQSHDSSTMCLLSSYMPKLFGLNTLRRYAIASSVSLWQLDCRDMAVSMLHECFGHSGSLHHGRHIPPEMLQQLSRSESTKHGNHGILEATTKLLEGGSNNDPDAISIKGKELAALSRGLEMYADAIPVKPSYHNQTPLLDESIDVEDAYVSNDIDVNEKYFVYCTGKLKVLDQSILHNSELNGALYEHSSQPENIASGNKIARLLFGDLYVAIVKKGCEQSGDTDHSFFDDISLEQLLSVRNFYSDNRSCLSALLLSAHELRLRKQHTEALDRYLDAFCNDVKQPLTALCLATHLVYLSTRPLVSRLRHETLSKALMFLKVYTQLRLNCTLETPSTRSEISNGENELFVLGLRQEVAYNTGRMFHEIEQHHHAQEQYFKVLAALDENPNLKGSQYDFSHEAAFNIIRIFKSSSNCNASINASIDIMQKYLLFDA